MARTVAGGVERGGGGGGRARGRRSHPSLPVPCPCLLRQAWGSLNALVGRFRAAFEEHGGQPEANPFGARAVRLYLHEVYDCQAKARGIAYEKKRRRRRYLLGEPAASPLPPPPLPERSADVGACVAIAVTMGCTPLSPAARRRGSYRALARCLLPRTRSPPLPLRRPRARPPPPPPHSTPLAAVLTISAVTDATPCERALREKREIDEERDRR
uniref:ALOG domain-containing protein n=1 Tax=Oryza sativa subsp. japonica TaxID=39947 RepID=Q6Z0B3_ORYSJ|nr:hypothetical protein [Oryza sativa Japonica Group]BAD05671.1 hypothetical protein [Oryza sativa Japonica Group]